MLGEDDQLAAMALGVEHLGIVLEQAGELVPFAVGAGLADAVSEFLQVLEHPDFDLQLRDGAGRRGLVDDLLLGLFDFGVGGVVEVVEVVVGVQIGRPAFRSTRTSAPRLRSCSSRSRFSSRSLRRRSD